MRLYEDVVSKFKEDVSKSLIADKISNQYQEYYKRKVGPAEKNSWTNSMNFVKNVLDNTPLNDNKIIIEYELPYSQKRIDILIFGKDEKGNDNIVIIELKQWSNDSVKDSLNEDNVRTFVGGGWREVLHPSSQVEGYYWYLKDFITIFEEDPNLLLNACIYCHNYNKGENEILYLSKFKESLEKYPIFSKQEIMDLGNYLKEKLASDSGFGIFNRFNKSIFRPSRKLMDHTSEMINNQQIFNLIDEQKIAYNAIMTKAKQISKLKEKSVIIIKGGPGTGKSVIALEVMGELLSKGINVIHATGSSAFTNTLKNILGTRSAKQFKFFNSFIDKSKYKENGIDVLICDEAHRIRKTSERMYTSKDLRTGEPQINELIL